ncbi:hypothetical protein Pmani_028536 [Petrolisthes manimaculis]|uniref:Fibrinogen C-terminal domain-containing protein n=1 Tax=Petrolisthes manimaculis TaxID=1843537 RepID=A0AAE1P1C5_9EUCA|nr:hypothetical protein Pmani_028536 [Petrolisthes manimaculis]
MKVVWAVLWAAVMMMVGVAANHGAHNQEVKEVEDENEGQERQMFNFSTTYEPTTVRPVDCADHLMAGAKTSGVYEIYPFTCSCNKPVLVWCDMETDGGGWTVFLSRQDTSPSPQVDFNRTWQEYKDGFGSPYDEYYLGNEMLHVMTQSRAYTLRLNTQQISGGISFATYENIRVGDEDSRYLMTLSGTQHGISSMTNCFRHLSGRYFTTLDYNSDSGTLAL